MLDTKVEVTSIIEDFNDGWNVWATVQTAATEGSDLDDVAFSANISEWCKAPNIYQTLHGILFLFNQFKRTDKF